MLTENKAKWLFLVLYATLICLQIYSALHHQLFGDEAFYWLESQHLAWSYAELPGWTQWTIAFSQWLLPQHEFTIRLPGLLAAWSLPWLGMFVSQKVSQNQNNDIWQTGLLLMTLPMLAVAGVLAVPDIWLTFFGMLCVLSLFQSIKTNQRYWFLLLGFVLAIGINVHVRFWIIVLLACLVVLWQFKHRSDLIKKLMIYSFPVMLFGFVPILLFNFENHFALLSFQFSDRHPWVFQSSHFYFFPIQLLVASPLVFWLCLKVAIQNDGFNSMQKTLAGIALLHWLTYALIGFFSDNLRFNAHWTVFTYFLLLVLAGSIPNHSRLKSWSIISGIVCSFALIIALFYALQIAQPVTKLNAQITENFQGWHQLSEKTDAIIQQGSFEFIVADNFMTLAELKFYSKKANKITTLSHPSNIKHGREQQLAIMGYNQEKTSGKGLLIVEHSGLKLEQMIPFYVSACATLNGIKLIDSLDYSAGVKSFYYFKTGEGQCKLPPISYFQQQNSQLTGWVVGTKNDPPSIKLKIELEAPEFKFQVKSQVKPLGKNPLFQVLDNKQYQLIEFKLDNAPTKSAYQVQFDYLNLTIFSSRIYPD